MSPQAMEYWSPHTASPKEFSEGHSPARREPPSVTQWYTHEKLIHGIPEFSIQFVEKALLLHPVAFPHLSKPVTTLMH